MKKSILFLLFLLPLALLAQNPGCDGQRYKDDVFSSVTKTTVKYATAPSFFFGQTMDLFMDVYQPANDVITERPVVVLAHGGSFIFGDKADMQSWCEAYAKKGYVAVSMQYRLYPAIVFGFPDSLDVMDAAMKAVSDMKAAVRFLRMDAATTNTFRVDPDHVFVGGYSAGAVTALHAGYLDAADVVPTFLQTILAANGGLEGNSSSGDALNYSASADAVLNISGGLYRRVWINTGDIPLVSIHGDADATVAYTSGLANNIAYLEGSALLHQRCDAVGVWNNLTTVPGGGHTNTYTDPAFASYVATFVTVSSDKLEELTCAITNAADLQLADTNWQMFPNPASGNEVDLVFPTGVLRAQVLLFNSAGSLCQRKIVNGAQAKLEIGNLPSGIYSVQLTDLDHPGQELPLLRLIK